MLVKILMKFDCIEDVTKNCKWCVVLGSDDCTYI